MRARYFNVEQVGMILYMICIRKIEVEAEVKIEEQVVVLVEMEVAGLCEATREKGNTRVSDLLWSDLP